MARRLSAKAASGGLRKVLIADRQRRLARWTIPGKPDDILEVLREHSPVLVSAAKLEEVMPGSRFGSGRNDEFFLLDERGELREVTG